MDIISIELLSKTFVSKFFNQGTSELYTEAVVETVSDVGPNWKRKPEELWLLVEKLLPNKIEIKTDCQAFFRVFFIEIQCSNKSSASLVVKNSLAKRLRLPIEGPLK